MGVCHDKTTKMLRTQNYNVVRHPRDGINPLDLIGAFKDAVHQLGGLDKLITNARFAESKPLYDGMVKDMIKLAHDEAPRIPLVQPMMDVAMQPNITGYTYWFHLEPDYRQLAKGPVPAA